MALANFFSKAALAAADILHGFDPAVFEKMLMANVIGIVYDDSAVQSREGQLTLRLATNLLARLYPRIAIVGNPPGNELASQLAALAYSINPDIEIEQSLDNITACLVVGSTAPHLQSPAIYVGSEGWIVRVSSHQPAGSTNTGNLFGAGAAACFGAANVFRMLFADQLPNGSLDTEWSLSILDLSPDSPTPANPPLPSIHIGESFLVGAGAIGNAAIWALTHVADVRGMLHIIDHEPVELSNLQRYILTNQEHIGAGKVALAEQALSTTAIEVNPHPKRWGEYLRTRQDWRLDRVMVAVDSARVRWEIQASLPRWIANAWTQPGDLGVSRHSFVGDQACVMCLYLPEGQKKNEDQLVAEAIGLPEAIQEIRHLLYTGQPVEQGLLERIATALQVPIEPLLPFVGQPLRTFYTDAICGGIILQLGGMSGYEVRAEVPMAFQSALAGILLAAELIAHAGGLKVLPPPVTTRINLLRPLGSELSLPAPKHPSDRCICQDRDYLAAYRAKYNLN